MDISNVLKKIIKRALESIKKRKKMTRLQLLFSEEGMEYGEGGKNTDGDRS